MGQHIQRPDGKMAGSIGDGRSGAPTAQPGVPTSTAGAASAPSLTAALTALTPTSASPAPQLLVPDAHASWGMDIDDLCLACGRDISEWSAGHAGALERTIVGARMPDPALRVFNGYDIGARTKITGRVCATCLPSVDTAAGQPVADDRAIEQIDVGDDCVYCGTDTSPGSSSYVNRIPAGTSGQDMDGAQLRAFSQYAIGAHTRVEGHACPGCMTRDCDRCGHPIAMDEDVYGDNGDNCCLSCVTAQELVNRRVEDGQIDPAPAVTVRLTSIYDGDEVTATITLPGPADGVSVEDWFEDTVYPLTGTGRASGTYEESGYFAEITDAEDPALTGQESSWGV